MRKLKLLAIIALAIGIVAFNSCKKDELTNNNETKALTSTFNPNEIENMDEYLLGFMKEIKTATRDSKPMLLEDAQWHLSACLNFQFCNANVERTQVVYDTIYTTINVNDGYVSLNDINASLQEISTEVLAVYNSSELENKNVLFIKPEIQNDNNRNGNTVRTIVATSGRDGEHYYFDYIEYLHLDTVFPPHTFYKWDLEAIEILNTCIERYMPYRPTDQSLRDYYIVTLSDSISNGYIFYGGNINETIEAIRMCYFLDLYLGLIADKTETYSNLEYISAFVEPRYDGFGRELNKTYYHIINANYGRPISTNIPIGGGITN